MGRWTATLTGLLVRVRILNWRMTRASALLSEREDAADSTILLAGAREWVRLHIRIAKLFDMPVPESVAEMRDLLGEPGGSITAEPPSVAHPGRAAAVLPK